MFFKFQGYFIHSGHRQGHGGVLPRHHRPQRRAVLPRRRGLRCRPQGPKKGFTTIRGVNFNFWQKEAKILKNQHYNGHEENCVMISCL